MSNASVRTFLKQIEDGKIDKLKHQLYVKIHSCPSISTKTLVDKYGAHQSVTSALSNLESLGVIRKSGTIEMHGRVFSQWVAHSDPDAIALLQHLVEQQKRHLWIKRAQRNGWIDDQVATFLAGLILDK
jgi:hypothetical protein